MQLDNVASFPVRAIMDAAPDGGGVADWTDLYPGLAEAPWVLCRWERTLSWLSRPWTTAWRRLRSNYLTAAHADW